VLVKVYVTTDPGLAGAEIGGNAIAEVCIRKPSVAVKSIVSEAKLG
jgi:hypothetical protein